MAEYNKLFKKLVEYETFEIMNNELLCDIKARLKGIIKKPTDETADSEVCLVDILQNVNQKHVLVFV